MKLFEKATDHPLVALLEEKMKQAHFSEMKKEIFQKLPKNFDPESPVLYSTPGEDYLEWIDIIEAAKSAQGRFVMFELGAGFGRWCMNAMHALNFLNPLPFHFVAVEAEKSHFNFLKLYFEAHGLKLEDHRLIEAAVDVEFGQALFNMGEPNGWYGQYLDDKKPSLFHRLAFFLRNSSKKEEQTERRKDIVKTITLNSLLEEYDRVDLIDMDIQSAELKVLQASIELLNKKVKRVHIGTHSKEIDEGLKNLFLENKWTNVHLFPSFTTCPTPYGVVEFNDGIQSWVNPKIG